MSSHIVRSVCPYDCPDACGLLVTVENGRAVGVSGDPGHPVTRGLICAKMRRYHESVHSERRITSPLLRCGEKGSGRFTPVSWEDALERIVSRFHGIIGEHGAEAILPYSYAGTMGLLQRNAGHAFFHRLGASRLERTICAPAKEAGWKAVMGDTPAIRPEEMLESDLVILWGMNAAATSISTMKMVLEAKKKGARIWLVDTWSTDTARFADEVILVRPGSDGALALAMIHVFVSRGMHDREYISDNVSGFREFCGSVIKGHTPEKASLLTGVPVDLIERLAHEYGSADAPFIRLGSGLTRYGNGAMNIRCITCLPAVTGAWKKPGGGVFCGTATGSAFPLGSFVREDFICGPKRTINMNCLGSALNEADEPPVKALFVYHANPAAVSPDQNFIVKGLCRGDLFTVVHERFMTDTARYADIILPATSSLEHSDLYRSYGNYHAQKCGPCIGPVGESRSNWDLFRSLAAKMGFREEPFLLSTEEVIGRILDEPSAWRDERINEELRSGRPVLLNVCGDSRTPATRSGKIEILNNDEPEPLPRHLPCHAEGDGLPLSLQTVPSRHSLNSTFYEREDTRKNEIPGRVLINPAEAASRGLSSGEAVELFNETGSVRFFLETADAVPAGIALTVGVPWHECMPGGRNVNALVSQRLTDRGRGSTFCDNRVDVKKAG